MIIIIVIRGVFVVVGTPKNIIIEIFSGAPPARVARVDGTP